MKETSFEKFLRQLRHKTILSVIVSVLVVAGFVGGVILLNEKFAKGVTELELSGTINGYKHVSGNAVIKRGGTITHDQGNSSGRVGMELRIDRTLTLEENAKIDVSGKGYKGGGAEFSEYGIWNGNVYPIDAPPWFARLTNQKPESYRYDLSAFYAAEGSQEGQAVWAENGSGKGGDWQIGGTGGGNGYLTKTRGASAGGGGGAYGYGSGAKSNYDRAGIGTCPGGGAGWAGIGGIGQQCSGIDLAEGNGTLGSFNYDSSIRFGGGGGVGVGGFYNFDRLPTEFKGGSGGGAIKIIADKLILKNGSAIEAKGSSGSYRASSLANQSGLSAGGGGGTIYIEVNELELETNAEVYFDAGGGDGKVMSFGDGSVYSASGAGGGGIIYIKVNRSLKIGGVPQANFLNLTPLTRETGGIIRNVLDNAVFRSLPGVNINGGEGKEIFEGILQVPAQSCDAEVKDTDFTQSINSAYSPGDTISIRARFRNYKTQSSCIDNFYTQYDYPFKLNLKSEKIFDGNSQEIQESAQNSRIGYRYWDVTNNRVGDHSWFYLEAELEVPLDICFNLPDPNIGQISIMNSYGTAPDTHTIPSSPQIVQAPRGGITINCPNIDIIGDVGTGRAVATDKLKIKAPSVVSAGTVSFARHENGVVYLSNYSHDFDFTKIETNFRKIENQRARRLGNNRNLNLYNKPEGGVWKSESILTNLNVNDLIDSGTIFFNHSLVITNIGWAGSRGMLGMYVDGDVTIRDSNFNNVAVYATGKIIFESGSNLDISGVFIGHEIEFNNISGEIRYPAKLVDSPPPGFSNLLKKIELIEKVPQ